jgi:hypothetical protein
MLWGQKPLYAAPQLSFPKLSLVGALALDPPYAPVAGGGGGSSHGFQQDMEAQIIVDDAEVELLVMQALAAMSG